MIAYYKTEVPFLRLVLFFILGISISIIYNLVPNLYNEIVWIILFSIISLSFIFLRKTKIYLNSHIQGVLIYGLMVLSGIVICSQHKEIYDANHFSKKPSQQLIGYITEEPKIKGDIARFVVEIENNINNNKVFETKGKLLLALRFDTLKKLDLNYGDLILLKSKFKDTEIAYNPSEFNYKRFLSFQQIYHQCFINKKEISVIGRHHGNPIKEFALNFREKQVEKFNTYLKDNDAKAVASTLILGYRAELSRDVLDTYSKTGTMHVLSVSGMHVAIVVGFLSFLLSFMNSSKKGRITKAIIIIFLVWFYALLTGLAPSVERAAIMISFTVIAKTISSRVNIFNILAIAAFILLLSNPFNATNVGFQLSFIAVGGLIYLYPKVYSLFTPENKILKIIWSTISVSIAAQLATAPISLYYFHQFPVYFILSNLFIFIPAILIMYTGIVFLIFSFYSPISKVLGILLNEIIVFTNHFLKFIEEIPHANVSQIWVNVFEIFLFYVALVFILMSVKNLKFLKYAFAIILIFSGIFAFKQYHHINQKQAVFFSLRKNTAVAFIKGRNAVLITDLKEDEFTYLFSVKPYLDSCHVDEIAFVNPHIKKTEQIYNFEGKTLKIVNKSSRNYQENKTNWLLLSTDKISDISQLIKNNNFEELFIDGKNRDFVIKDLQAQANNFNIKPRTLKREFAVEIKF